MKNCFRLIHCDDQVGRGYLYRFFSFLFEDTERDVLRADFRFGPFNEQGGFEQVIRSLCGSDGLSKGGERKENEK